MNLNKIRPKNDTEVIILLIPKKCETLNKQTHEKPQETLEFKNTTPRKTFSFTHSLKRGLDSNWVDGLTRVEVYIFIFLITEEYNKFEIHADSFDEVSLKN